MRITKAQETRANKFLDKLIRFTLNGKTQVTTYREFITTLVNDGYILVIEEEDKIKPMSRMQLFRADQQTQDAHAKRVKEAGKKQVHYLKKDAGIYQISKTEFDFAMYLMIK